VLPLTKAALMACTTDTQSAVIFVTMDYDIGENGWGHIIFLHFFKSLM
jgi:hypothetical protein